MREGAGLMPGSFFQATARCGPPARGKDPTMSKKISIAFPQGGIVPGSVLGKKEDQTCAAMEPVSVPEAYGRHLIEDRFAVEVTDAGKTKKKAEAGSGKGGKTGDPNPPQDSPEIAAAKASIDEAEQLVAASGTDAAAKAEAEAMLKAAQDKLAQLQA